ncbi:hypothetical protein M3J09_002280 [Ascochyta lentis]
MNATTLHRTVASYQSVVGQLLPENRRNACEQTCQPDPRGQLLRLLEAVYAHGRVGNFKDLQRYQIVQPNI